MTSSHMDIKITNQTACRLCCVVLLLYVWNMKLAWAR